MKFTLFLGILIFIKSIYSFSGESTTLAGPLTRLEFKIPSAQENNFDEFWALQLEEDAANLGSIEPWERVRLILTGTGALSFYFLGNYPNCTEGEVLTRTQNKRDATSDGPIGSSSPNWGCGTAVPPSVDDAPMTCNEGDTIISWPMGNSTNPPSDANYTCAPDKSVLHMNNCSNSSHILHWNGTEFDCIQDNDTYGELCMGGGVVSYPNLTCIVLPNDTDSITELNCSQGQVLKTSSCVNDMDTAGNLSCGMFEVYGYDGTKWGCVNDTDHLSKVLMCETGKTIQMGTSGWECVDIPGIPVTNRGHEPIMGFGFFHNNNPSIWVEPQLSPYPQNEDTGILVPDYETLVWGVTLTTSRSLVTGEMIEVQLGLNSNNIIGGYFNATSGSATSWEMVFPFAFKRSKDVNLRPLVKPTGITGNIQYMVTMWEQI